jgi:hypothetical protein
MPQCKYINQQQNWPRIDTDIHGFAFSKRGRAYLAKAIAFGEMFYGNDYVVGHDMSDIKHEKRNASTENILITLDG